MNALLWVRVLNALGAFALAFLAVLAGPDLAGAALAIFGAGALVSRWGGALLLDRMAPRGVLVLGLFATGVALAAMALARTPWQVLVTTALAGLAFEIYEPATSELLARLTPDHQRETAFGRLGTWLVAAGAVAGLLATAILPLGVRWLIAVDAGTCFAAAAVARIFLPVQSRPVRSETRQRWRPPASLVLLTTACTAYALGYLAMVMFTPFLMLQRGAPAWLPGLTLTGAALLAPPAGWLAQRLLRGRSHLSVLRWGTVALGLVASAMTVAPSASAAAAGFLCWAGVNAVLLGRWPAVVADLAPAEERPRWFAFTGLSWGLAQPAVPGAVALVSTMAGDTAASAPLTAGAAFLLVPIVLAAPVRMPSGGVRPFRPPLGRRRWCSGWCPGRPRS